jgi:hypothetical protein
MTNTEQRQRQSAVALHGTSGRVRGGFVRSRTGLGRAQQREESPEAAGEGAARREVGLAREAARRKGGRKRPAREVARCHEPYVDVLATAKKRQMGRRWRRREGREGFRGG